MLGFATCASSARVCKSLLTRSPRWDAVVRGTPTACTHASVQRRQQPKGLHHSSSGAAADK
eukprot:3863328-Pyramimonas_sp.AAC.1